MPIVKFCNEIPASTLNSYLKNFILDVFFKNRGQEKISEKTTWQLRQ